MILSHFTTTNKMVLFNLPDKFFFGFWKQLFCSMNHWGSIRILENTFTKCKPFFTEVRRMKSEQRNDCSKFWRIHVVPRERLKCIISTLYIDNTNTCIPDGHESISTSRKWVVATLRSAILRSRLRGKNDCERQWSELFRAGYWIQSLSGCRGIYNVISNRKGKWAWRICLIRLSSASLWTKIVIEIGLVIKQ